MSNPTILCVIPARYGSTRLPAKALIEVGGMPLVMWVWHAARKAGAFDRVVVATDDSRIVEAVERGGGEALLTAATHERGTDRVHEVAQRLPSDYVVNLQGDEPEVPPELLARFAETLRRTVDDNALLTCVSSASRKEIDNPNTVKVVLSRGGDALYFSRSPIPYDHGSSQQFVKHTGIYGFSAAGLRRFCSFAPGSLERLERLEQLRALENGMTIHCLFHDHRPAGIDTPEDLAAFRARVSAAGGAGA